MVTMVSLRLGLFLTFVALTASMEKNSTLVHPRAKRYLDIIDTTRIFVGNKESS